MKPITDVYKLVKQAYDSREEPPNGRFNWPLLNTSSRDRFISLHTETNFNVKKLKQETIQEK